MSSNDECGTVCFLFEGCRVPQARVLCALTGMTDAIITIIRTEGTGALFKGLNPALIGTAPYAALNFASYDLLKKFFYGTDARQEPLRVPYLCMCKNFHAPIVTEPPRQVNVPDSTQTAWRYSDANWRCLHFF
jgi:hypothetical protein